MFVGGSCRVRAGLFGFGVAMGASWATGVRWRIGIVAVLDRLIGRDGLGHMADVGAAPGPYDLVVFDGIRSLVSDPRVPDAPGPLPRDVLLVAAAVVCVTVEAVVRPDVQWRWPAFVVAVGVIVLLPWRRQRPLAVVTAGFVAIGVFDLARVIGGTAASTGYHSMAVVMVAVYALCRWASGRDRAVGLGIVFVVATVGVALGSRNWSDVVGGYAVVAAVVAAGIAVRVSSNARLRTLEQARSLERERLARDLHDTVAHHVSAIVISAQAGLSVAATHPGRAVDSLRTIEREGSRALSEMRSIVGTLREAERVRAPTATLEDLDTLAGASDRAPRVTVELDVEPDTVNSVVSAALFRVAQESVTNARRHARHATRVSVDVSARDGIAELRVSDDGDHVDGHPGAGFGLVGMSERVSALGGTFRYGPRPGRGWVVVARVPVKGAAR